MCGVSAILGEFASVTTIEMMNQTMQHRGPDSGGIYTNQDAHIALGHRRLKILDTSNAAKQPMTSACGRYVLVFNGEIYNYLELREKLPGLCLRSQSDTEILLELLARKGTDILGELVGMFAFALWDNKDRSLLLARDPFGIKPLYFACHEKSLVVASEIRPLLKAGVPAATDWEMWGDYFCRGLYNHSNRTFFKGITSLPGGSYLKLQESDICHGQVPAPTTFWDPVQALHPDQSPSCQDHRIGDPDETWGILQESVKLHLRSDVPVGINLSGGMDSSLLCLMADQFIEDGQPICTFTMGYGDAKYDEIIHANIVPRRRAWRRREIIITPEEIKNNFAPAILSMEEPVGGIATIAYQKLHRDAKSDGFSVLLEGQGLDEIFGGYNSYCSLLSESSRTETEVKDTGSVPKFYQDNTRFLMPEVLRPSAQTCTSNLCTFESPLPTATENAMYADLLHRRVPRVLRMNDRLSMAESVELREPFLTTTIAEHGFRLRLERRVQPNQAKAIIFEHLREIYPDQSHIWKRKRSVSAPQREWLRGPLKDFAWDHISSQSFAELGVFDVNVIKREFEQFVRSKGGNSFFVWQWLNLHQWHQTFMKSTP